ncbi:aldo-keto reductase [Lindgomyces ingoldianus]|uniref:Aldo-keto reductase n=1 Tax=Lindgomyces ingoldianus TaxID=673940 RepID=A0ACB6RBB0_9PLEO|nr:aldo-keto reductase [Lindgomyces ingoldianus]KAF2476005.1 aldo-keto reductase [Lindgomyces ingoldianus]
MATSIPLPQTLQASADATKVEYVQLGTSGLRLSYPILGGMTLGSSQWENWVLDEDAALEILKAAYDRGINTWDTANAYSNGASEEVMGKALKKFGIERRKVIIMTKCWAHVAEEAGVVTFMYGPQMEQTKDYVNQGGLSRAAIFDAVDASLARLQTSYIDVLQIHRFDPTTPIEETMKALHDLVQSGKVRYLGASSMWATQFAKMQFVAEKNGWTRFVGMQNLYNLCYREEEREMIRFCKSTGVGLIPWSPMLGGKLAWPLNKNTSVRATTSSPMNPVLTSADEEIIRRVEKVAKDKGCKMSQVALAWVRIKGGIPIVGFNSVDRIEDACGLRGLKLSDEEVKFLEEPYVPKNVIGHW